MNTTSSPQNGDTVNRLSEEDIHESIYPCQHEVNITDGGEFLDDAIRMEDQPFGKPNVNENK